MALLTESEFADLVTELVKAVFAALMKAGVNYRSSRLH